MENKKNYILVLLKFFLKPKKKLEYIMENNLNYSLNNILLSSLIYTLVIYPIFCVFLEKQISVHTSSVAIIFTITYSFVLIEKFTHVGFSMFIFKLIGLKIKEDYLKNAIIWSLNTNLIFLIMSLIPSYMIYRVFVYASFESAMILSILLFIVFSIKGFIDLIVNLIIASKYSKLESDIS